jgi:hypothetical protein
VRSCCEGLAGSPGPGVERSACPEVEAGAPQSLIIGVAGAEQSDPETEREFGNDLSVGLRYAAAAEPGVRLSDPCLSGVMQVGLRCVPPVGAPEQHGHPMVEHTPQSEFQVLQRAVEGRGYLGVPAGQPKSRDRIAVAVGQILADVSPRQQPAQASGLGLVHRWSPF